MSNHDNIALQLADRLDAVPETGADPELIEQAAAELRRLVAENEQLRAQMEAIGAGGVGPLMPTTVQHQRKLSSDNDLKQKTCHLITTSSSVPFGYKLVPVEPTPRMKRAAFPASGPVTADAVYRAMLDAAPQPPVVEQHTDDAAVNRFAEAMKAKLAVARDKGRGGWDDPAQCTVEYLAKLLVDHIAKGDPIDVANFAMMLHQRQADKSVLSAAAPTPPAVDHPEPAYLLRDLADDISVDALDLIAAIRDAGLVDYSINMRLPARVCVAMCKRFADVGRRPVARVAGTGHLGGHFDWCVPGNQGVPRGTLLYTSPQPQRKPLTNEQIKKMLDNCDDGQKEAEVALAFARAIERAHGIGQEAAPQQPKNETAPGLGPLMTSDDILRMAREAGMLDGWSLSNDMLEQFAALVAAAEREACAKVCESYSDDEWLMLQQDDCAAAVRAGGRQ